MNANNQIIIPDTHKQVITSTDPIVAVIAPNRTGKTTSIALLLLLIALGKRPVYSFSQNSDTSEPNIVNKKNVYVIFSTITYQMAWSVFLTTLMRVFSAYNLADAIKTGKHEQKIIINCSHIKGGRNVIIYVRTECQGFARVQGLTADLFIQDEQLTDENYHNEMIMRVTTTGGQRYYFFTPTLGRNWLTDFLIRKAKVYKYKIEECPWVSKSTIEKMAEHMTDTEKKIRLEGEIVETTGMSFVDLNKITLASVKHKYTYNDIDVYQYSDMPDPHDIIVIGCDMATGKHDYTVIAVYAHRADSIYPVEVYRSIMLDIPTTTQLLHNIYTKYKKYTHHTYLIVDGTGVGTAVAQQLINLNVVPLTSLDAKFNYITNGIGFIFTQKSREWLLTSCQLWWTTTMHGKKVYLPDVVLSELPHFKFWQNKFQAERGFYDDIILCLAITMYGIYICGPNIHTQSHTSITYDGWIEYCVLNTPSDAPEDAQKLMSFITSSID